MNREFHYYMTGIIARAAGFREAEARTIATAAEYVDENDVAFIIHDRAGGPSYECYISQTMNILKPKHTLMRIYPVFHFVPGDPGCDSACRCDGKMHLLNTTPGNEIAMELLNRAFTAPEGMRYHRIGVASHAFADTWAHQNFVGWYDVFNDVGLDPKPNIGHADAEHHPDWFAHRWDDVRLVKGEIDNTERFLDAAESLFREYRRYLRGKRRRVKTTWKTLRETFLTIAGPSRSGSYNVNEEARLDGYRAEVPWLGDFSEDDWLFSAIETEVHGLPDTKKGLFSPFTVLKDRHFWRTDVEKEKTDWFRFQEAAKAHQRDAMELMKPRFERMGIDLHRY